MDRSSAPDRFARKGNVSSKIAIYGQADKAKPMEKSIALQALSKV